jgi:hypothetical protein
MKKTSVVLLCPLLATALLTVACTPKTSVERHARQYVYAADDGFDPNFRIKKADSARLIEPFFQQFRDMGVKDKAAGVSREDALARSARFTSSAFLKSIQGKTAFAGKTYDDSQPPKALKAMGNAISATYLDGYEGRP